MRNEIGMEICFNVSIEMIGIRSWFLNFASMVYGSASGSGAWSLNYFGSSKSPTLPRPTYFSLSSFNALANCAGYEFM
jgi:hypothetical protein